MKAYCKLCPVFQSRTTSTDFIGPNLENIIYKSLSWVTGLSLHTKRIFSGGLTSASGSYPNIYKVIACFFAFCNFVASIISASDEYFSSIYKCSIASSRSGSLYWGGLAGYTNFYGSGKGSSKTKVWRILMFICGRDLSST